MSCDYCVWHCDPLPDAETAATTFEALCEEDDSIVNAHPSVADFYHELIAIHPELGNLPENEIDETPWSCSFQRSPGYIIMNCRWDFEEYCYKLIKELAIKHGLCLYDPQSDVVIRPDTTHQPSMISPKKDPLFWRMLRH
jgi:hypothetical protein